MLAGQETKTLELHSSLYKLLFCKGGFKSEETGEFFHCQNKYSKSLS